MAQNDELLQPWAQSVYESLGMPTSTSASTISGYAVSPNTLGRVNSLLSTCFTGSGYTGVGSVNYQIGPYVSPSVLGIIGQLYTVSLYNNLAMASLGQGASALPWTALSEGDSKIVRVSAANIGKEYREMSKTAWEELWAMINAYRNDEGGGTARAVDYYSPPVGPYSYGYNY